MWKIRNPRIARKILKSNGGLALPNVWTRKMWALKDVDLSTRNN